MFPHFMQPNSKLGHHPLGQDPNLSVISINIFVWGSVIHCDTPKHQTSRLASHGLYRRCLCYLNYVSRPCTVRSTNIGMLYSHSRLYLFHW